MATAMTATVFIFYQTLACVLLITSSNPQEVPDNTNAENNVLNLHYDHCRRPMQFSWKKLKCECPPPLKRVNNECVCDNCITEEVLQWYHEGTSNDLPQYINEVFEEIDGDLEEGEKSEAARNGTDEHKAVPKADQREAEISRPDADEPFLDVDKIDDEEGYIAERRRRSTDDEDILDDRAFIDSLILNVHGRLFIIRAPNMPISIWPWHKHILNRWYFDENYNIREKGDLDEYADDENDGRRSAKGRIVWRRPRPIAEELIMPPEHRIFYPRPRVPMDVNKQKVLKLKGRPSHTFSDSVVGGSIEGGTVTGYDRARGTLSSYRGTGALAIGTGGGGAASSAYTGLGSSDLMVASKGASANGQGYIGEKAKDGTSTTSLLIGSGDAIGINARAQKGSSSAAGISTKYVAAGASAAYGPASASVSATPGQGATGSSATFNEGINTNAQVASEGGTIVESSSVGDYKQNVNKLNSDKAGLFRSPIRIEPAELDFSSLFNRK